MGAGATTGEGWTAATTGAGAVDSPPAQEATSKPQIASFTPSMYTTARRPMSQVRNMRRWLVAYPSDS